MHYPPRNVKNIYLKSEIGQIFDKPDCIKDSISIDNIN